MAGINYEDRSSLYEQAVKSLKKFKGDLEVSKGPYCVKLEPAYLAGNKNALLAAGFVKPKSYRQQCYKKREAAKDRGGGGTGFSDKQTSVQNKGVRKKRINPLGVDGQVLRCMSCGSYRHLLDVCPDSWENMEKKKTSVGKHVKPLDQSDKEKIKHTEK